MVAVHLYADHLAAATRQQLQRDAARTREKVEGGGTFEVYILHQHVEDVLLGKVRRRTCLERAWDIEMTTLIFSCDYSHNFPLSMFNVQCSMFNVQCSMFNVQRSTFIVPSRIR